MRFVICDSSTDVGNDLAYGGPISPAQLVQIAYALNEQLNRDVASYWGGAYAVRAGSGPTDIQPGEVACALLDELPNVPGAVAYHDVNGLEVPVVFLSRTSCNSIMSGSGSVSAALSHECNEVAIDPYVNAWRQAPDGTQQAQEGSDPVQEWSYQIAGVTVSDFVLPAYWGPGSSGPWNYGATIGQDSLSGPFTIAPGGYAIVQQAGGGETQVQGQIASGRLAKKRHPTSRTYRRGARL